MEKFTGIVFRKIRKNRENREFEGKAMAAIANYEGVKIGAVVVKKKEKEKLSFPIELQCIEYSIVDESGKFFGVLGLCRYNHRYVYQYISEEKMKQIGLAEEGLEPYTVRKKKGGRGGKGESMTLISYVVLKDTERGNKLLREYDYEKNRILRIDILEVAYQNSTVKLNWICEICGKEFESLLNNRVGHTQSDCECFRSFYKTSTNEELVALMLKKSIPNLETQVPVFGDRRRVDMSFESGGRKFIIEYDGIFHDREKDYERDKEAHELGYTTIRIIEITPMIINLDRLYLFDEIGRVRDTGGYNYETDTHIIVANFYKNRDELLALDSMFMFLANLLSKNGIEIETESVTHEMIKEAKNNRKKYQKKVEVH